MVKKIKELKLIKDTIFNESIEVEGNITGYFNLKVAWNITARDITAGDITARDITAENINAWDITAENINARDINAWNITARDITAGDIIFCETIKSTGKIKARVLVKERSKLVQKEWK